MRRTSIIQVKRAFICLTLLWTVYGTLSAKHEALTVLTSQEESPDCNLFSEAKRNALLSFESARTANSLTRTADTHRPKNLRIPFRYINGFIIVDVIINRRLPLSFIFDTGSKHTILTDRRILPFLGQLPEEEIQVIGSDLSLPITGRLMRRTSIRVGDVDLTNQSLILLDDGILDLNSLSDESIHGILGIGAFGAYAVKIDYKAGLIELIETTNVIRDKKATIIPIRVEKSKAYIDIEATIHPGESHKLSLLLDTGASLSMLIYTSRNDSTLFPSKVISGTFGFGLGGNLEGYVGRSDLIKLGPQELPDIITHFQTLAKINSLTEVPTREGILGNGILDRFIVLIDFSRKELHLLPTKKYQRKTEYDRSGIRLVRDGEKLNNLRVQYISEGSPADHAGIKIGDELIKVGILPASWIKLPRIEDILRSRVGKTVRLTIKSDETETQKRITLKDLI